MQVVTFWISSQIVWCSALVLWAGGLASYVMAYRMYRRSQQCLRLAEDAWYDVRKYLEGALRTSLQAVLDARPWPSPDPTTTEEKET